MKPILIFFFCINGYLCSVAQAIHIGEKVPPLTLPMLQFKLPTVDLQDYKGRLVILDFWASSCSACLAQFPKLEQLQKQFSDSILILPVGFDGFNKGSIAKCLSQRKGTAKEIKLPTAIQKEGDSLLFKLFPFDGLPTEIWITPDGKLLAITDHLALTEQHIREVLSGGTLSAREKTKKMGFPEAGSVYFRSLILPWDPLLMGSIAEETNNNYTRLALPNQPLWLLAATAFLNSQDTLPDTIRHDNMYKVVLAEGAMYDAWHAFATNDPLVQTDSFQQRNCFSYESLLPPGTQLKEAYRLMLDELASVYRLSVKLEVRDTRCFVITKIPENVQVAVGLNNKPLDISDNYQEFSMKNGNIQNLLKWCNNFLYVPPVFCDIKGDVTVQLKLNGLNDIASFQSQLSAQGFILKRETIPLKRLVIRR